VSLAARSLAVTRSDVPAGLVAIPVRTRLIRPGDDLIGLIADAVRGIARDGDVVTVSESAVAIAEGEFVPAEYVRPSRLAYLLSRRAGPLATISQPESMQLVIDRAGTGRVIYATLAQFLGRMRGRRGAFYEIMGDAIAAIDGYTGTMAPYERAIVFAPRDPVAFARLLSERIGVAAAVVDANDLSAAKVLGWSRGVCTDLIAQSLLDNPHGNGDEQTPLVVLKWRGQGRNPLLEEDEP
jgi:hypothetical protein